MSSLFFGLAMRLYPRDFRDAFGAEMAEVFALRRAEIRREHGLGGLVVLWARTLPGLIHAAMLERFSLDEQPPRLPRKSKNVMESWLQDIRYGVRTLWHSPGFAAVAVLTLALGIGINTVIFSMVNAMVLRPLPQIEEPSRLVVMFTAERGGSASVSPYVDYLDFAERNRSLSGFAAYKPRAVDVTGAEGTERLDGMMVTDNYFELLGVAPHVGRFFAPEDNDEVGAETVAVLSHDLWQSAYGGDPSVVGDSVRLNGLSYDIIGVAPEGFRGTSLETVPQVYVPMMMQPLLMPSSGNLLDNRGWGGIYTVGRLADGVSLQQANTDFEGIADWLHATYPRFTEDRDYQLALLPEATLTPDDRGAAVGISLLLSAAVGVVLLVACVNVASLMLSRALRRRSEIAVRQALGAGRGRLVRQLIVESLTLSAIGGVVGLLLAASARGALDSLPMPFALDYSFDSRILGFTAVVSVVTGLVFGVVPAFAATRGDLSATMKSGAESPRQRRVSLSGVLVAAQVALSLLLLVAAGLFTRTFIAVSSTELGFEPDNAIVVGVDPSLQGYETAQILAYYTQVMERFEAMPTVQSASVASSLPAGGGDSLGFAIQGVSTDQRLSSSVMIAGPRYFETMGIPMRRGRDFSDVDRPDTEPVLIVNEAAEEMLAGLVTGDPMDARLSFRGPDGPFLRIVGVAADSKTTSLRAAPRPMMYAPFTQAPDAWTVGVLVRTTGAPEPIVPTLRGILNDVDANVPAHRIMTFNDYLATALMQERLLAGLVGLAALLTLALASVGLYGVLSFAVARRTREMGIRIAMGAGSSSVRALVVRQALVLVAVGGVFGIGGSLAAGSLLSSFLYGVSPTDPVTYGGVIGLLLVVAFAASYVPARRATRVDPLVALRTD